MPGQGPFFPSEVPKSLSVLRIYLSDSVFQELCTPGLRPETRQATGAPYEKMRPNPSAFSRVGALGAEGQAAFFQSLCDTVRAHFPGIKTGEQRNYGISDFLARSRVSGRRWV